MMLKPELPGAPETPWGHALALRRRVVDLHAQLRQTLAHCARTVGACRATRLAVHMPCATELTVALTWHILQDRGLLTPEEVGGHGGVSSALAPQPPSPRRRHTRPRRATPQRHVS